MKHKNLVQTFKSSTLQNSSEANEVTISGAEVVRLSEQEKSLNRLKVYKQNQDVKKQAALERLHNLELNVKDPSPDRKSKYDPNKFNDARGKLNLYWEEFKETFGYIAPAWCFTREDYKRYWLKCLGATNTEIANITGYSIEPINRWEKSIQRKINHNNYPAKWIETKATQEITLSGTSPELDLNKKESLDRLEKAKFVKQQIKELEQKAGIYHND